MQIRMKKTDTALHADGCEVVYGEGRVYEVDAFIGEQLLDKGSAVMVKPRKNESVKQTEVKGDGY